MKEDPVAASEFAVQFVEGLNQKFGESGKAFAVQSGRKYDRVAQSYGGGGFSAHAFVNRENGDVAKAGSWAGPQKDRHGNVAVRFNVASAEGLAEALEAADEYGSYLYAR
jgi:hypothetical protein